MSRSSRIASKNFAKAFEQHGYGIAMVVASESGNVSGDMIKDSDASAIYGFGDGGISKNGELIKLSFALLTGDVGEKRPFAKSFLKCANESGAVVLKEGWVDLPLPVFAPADVWCNAIFQTLWGTDWISRYKKDPSICFIKNAFAASVMTWRLLEQTASENGLPERKKEVVNPQGQTGSDHKTSASPKLARNLKFYIWYHDKNAPTYHSHAKIRDKWNAENNRDAIDLEASDCGRGVVKQGIRAAEEYLKKQNISAQKALTELEE